MTILNMTIILKLSKYDNLQYDNYFEKIVIFAFLNMTKKKTYGLFLELAILLVNKLEIEKNIRTRILAITLLVQTTSTLKCWEMCRGSPLPCEKLFSQ